MHLSPNPSIQVLDHEGIPGEKKTEIHLQIWDFQRGGATRRSGACERHGAHSVIRQGPVLEVMYALQMQTQGLVWRAHTSALRKI